jgi:Sensors of blue-light using FAD
MNSSNSAFEAAPAPLGKVFQLAYSSVLTRSPGETDWSALVEHASRKNRKKDITGVLMVNGTLVIQWIEGSKNEVKKLWRKLQSDPRHHCIVRLTPDSASEQRLFGRWTAQRASRREMLDILQNANECADRDSGQWSDALQRLCLLAESQAALATVSGELWDATQAAAIPRI